MRVRLSYVKEYKDQYGRTRRYFRYKGLPLIPLPGRPGTLEFQLAYNNALAQARSKKRAIGAARAVPGTMNAVIVDYYQSLNFKKFSENTRGMRRRILEKIRNIAGNDRLGDLQKGHIVSAFLSQLPPFERNNWLKTFRGLIKYAIEVGVIEIDPTAGIKRTEAKEGGSIHTWSGQEIAQFEARHGIGSVPRLALALLLYTAQRRSDAVRMGPQHVEDGILYVRQKKTKMEKQDRVLEIPVLPELQRIIDATPTGNLAFLVTQQGVPFTEKGFGVRFLDWCRQAGLPEGCSAHGLRKAALVRLAEAGCTEAELRAISGHKNLTELKPYIEKVEQKRLAKRAMRKLADERHENESVSETKKCLSNMSKINRL